MIGILPGMPLIPFWVLALCTGALAYRLRNARKVTADQAKAAAQAAEAPKADETPASALAMDEIRIELGFGLLALLNDVNGRRLTDQIKALRKSLAQDLGFVTPASAHSR